MSTSILLVLVAHDGRTLQLDVQGTTRFVMQLAWERSCQLAFTIGCFVLFTCA
jgi:hypothetical protein